MLWIISFCRYQFQYKKVTFDLMLFYNFPLSEWFSTFIFALSLCKICFLTRETLDSKPSQGQHLSIFHVGQRKTRQKMKWFWNIERILLLFIVTKDKLFVESYFMRINVSWNKFWNNNHTGMLPISRLLFFCSNVAKLGQKRTVCGEKYFLLEFFIHHNVVWLASQKQISTFPIENWPFISW